MVRFSSYITACSRINLLEGMIKVGHENVWYCDTDSIVCSKKLPESMISTT